MRSRFGGLSFGRDHWHSEHDSPGWLFGNHYGGLGYAFGTRGDDVLQGTEHRDFIIGLSGDDIISAGDGNDWVKGGYGNDVLDGGAGSDKVLSGNGDDVATYVLAENVGTDACGRETHDFYDGGKGFDVLQLILTPEEMKNQDVQDEIAAYRAFLAEHANPCSANGPVFEFQSFDLTVRNFEDVEVVGGNTPPVAQPDSFTTTEDPGLPVTITTASVLANDSDADHDALTAIFVDDAAHAPMNGTLTFNADGSVSYMPNPDFFGTDGFNYVLSDGTDQVEGSITIDVTPVNDPPQLKDPANPGCRSQLVDDRQCHQHGLIFKTAGSVDQPST